MINNYITVRVGKRCHYIPFDDTSDVGCQHAWIEAKRLASHNLKPVSFDEIASIWRAAPIPVLLPVVGHGPPMLALEDEGEAA